MEGLFVILFFWVWGLSGRIKKLEDEMSDRKFNIWWNKFEKLAKEKDFPISSYKEDYRSFYDDEYTPEEALEEEMLCAEE